MNTLIETLAPYLDNATYVNLFLYTLLLLPLLFVLPTVVYWVILRPAAQLLSRLGH